MTVSYTTENRVLRPATYTGPASYVTAGDAVAAADFGLSRLDYLTLSGGTESGYVVAHDPSAGKIKWFIADYSTSTDATLIEVSTDTNLSGESCGVIAVGLP